MGALDSMGWVDVLISIESVTGLRDFGSSWPDSRTKSIRALAEMIREAQRERPEENTSKHLEAGTRDEQEVAIGGWGYSLGSVTIDSEQIEQELRLPPRKIRDGAGIRTLRRAAATEDELVLGQRAADLALEMAEVAVEKIDILLTTSTTYLGLPSFAASLHARLLLGESCGAIDVGGACAGLIYSLVVAKGVLRTAPNGIALVVASEVHSRRLEGCHSPGEFRGLFGDGACAFLVTRAAHRGAEGLLRLGDFVWGCSGTFASALRVGVDKCAEATIRLNGEQLAHAAITQMDRIFEILENQSGRPRAEVNHFALHQPNPRAVEILAERARVPLEKILLISRSCGNLGSATCGVSLCQALTSLHESHDPSQAPLIFMAAVAPGLVWGGTFLFGVR
jgi:3-oxoacyl-[acyl-carrier-protein] synthase-3